MSVVQQIHSNATKDVAEFTHLIDYWTVRAAAFKACGYTKSAAYAEGQAKANTNLLAQATRRAA